MRRSALIAVVAVAVATSLAAAMRGTSAAFTDEQTTHMQITTGGVGLTRDGDGILFDTTPLAPGDTADATVKVTNSGSLPATVTFSRTDLGSTSPNGCDVRDALHLQVVEDGGAGRTLVDGAVTGASSGVDLGTFAPGEARSYAIHVTFAAQHGADATDNDNCFEGSVDRERFAWAAVEAAR